MNVVVVGCGRVGAELAYRMFKKGHRVVVVDEDHLAFAQLPNDFLGRTVEGEALSKDVLHRAGIETADALAIVTNSDPTNAILGHLARTTYNIPTVVVRNFDPAFRSLHEAFGLQVISSSSWGAQRMEEILAGVEMRTIFAAGNGEVEIYEFAVPDFWNGHNIIDLIPCDNCKTVSLTRAGKAIVPDADEVLQAGDLLLVSATFEGIECLRKRLLPGKEK